jgi:hypothetical protein
MRFESVPPSDIGPQVLRGFSIMELVNDHFNLGGAAEGRIGTGEVAVRLVVPHNRVDLG